MPTCLWDPECWCHLQLHLSQAYNREQPSHLALACPTLARGCLHRCGLGWGVLCSFGTELAIREGSGLPGTPQSAPSQVLLGQLLGVVSPGVCRWVFSALLKSKLTFPPGSRSKPFVE